MHMKIIKALEEPESKAECERIAVGFQGSRFGLQSNIYLLIF